MYTFGVFEGEKKHSLSRAMQKSIRLTSVDDKIKVLTQSNLNV
jgi:hypothetical protein